MADPTTKACSKCLVEKSLSEFSKYRRMPDGLMRICKSCDRIRTLKWREENPKAYRESRKKEYHSRKEHHRGRQLVYKYGVTLDGYAELLKSQGGLCKICNEPESARSRSGNPLPLAVDHCHETGKVRGLLCHKCNTGIGKLNDDAELLQKAIDYLKEHE